MPVAKGTDFNAVRAVVIGLVGVGLGIGLVVLMAQLARTGSVDVKLGDDVFEAGDAENRAESIERDGPVLFPDVAGGSRDIYINHLSDDPLEGWIAFDARRPGTDRECTLQWRADAQVFTDPCDETVVIDGGGGDLHRYEVTVTYDGDLEVEITLRGDDTGDDADTGTDGATTDRN
jgi:hypothetical protein